MSRRPVEPEPMQDGLHIAVRSNAAKSVAYDRPTQRLFVEFRNKGHRTYCYYDVPADVAQDLQDSRAGEILGGLKTRFRADKITSFPAGNITVAESSNPNPRPTRPPGGPARDYTAEWLRQITQVITAPIREDAVTVLLEMKAILTNIELELQSFPPNIPPPRKPGQMKNSLPPPPERARRDANIYSSLGSDGGPGEGRPKRSTPAAPSGSKVDPMQTRYISFEISCAIADSYRLKAIQMNRDSSIEMKDRCMLIAQSWQVAYDHFNDLMHNCDDWFAIYLDRYINAPDDHSSLLADSHDFRQLSNLLERAQMVYTDTETGRVKSLGYLQRHLQEVEEKLDPHLKSRDEAKKKMGVEKWENNPAPKLDYVKLRRDLEETRDALKVAIGMVTALQVDFYSE